MEHSLKLSSSLASPVIPVTGQQRLVYLLIEVSGGEGTQPLPSNLGFILDASDSMRIRLVTDEQFMELVRNGQAHEVMTDGVPAYRIKSISSDLISKFPRRIDYVSEALVIAGEYLRAVDRFCVVAFAERAQCMVSAMPGKEKARLVQTARELERLRLGDGTHMAEGIALAFQELQRPPGSSAALTPPGAVPLGFASRLILLTDGHTLKVKECYEWAQRARQAGIKLTTMGIGVEFNEDLLIPLADITGGNAYYIETPDQIPQVFRRELGAALRISYRNVEAKLLLPVGVELRRVYRVLPELSAFDQGPNMNNSYSLLMGDYDPAAPQAMLVELLAPAWRAGDYRLAQVLLAWDDPANKNIRQNQRQDVVIHVAEASSGTFDGRVMNIVEKVGVFKMGTQALEAAQNAAMTASREDRSNATVRLRQAATRLLDMGEPALAEAMLLQANMLEQHGNIDPDATKRLRYETRRLTQNL